MPEDFGDEVQQEASWKAHALIGGLVLFNLAAGGYIAVVYNDPIATILVGSIIAALIPLVVLRLSRQEVDADVR